MKRFLALILAVFMILGLASCEEVTTDSSSSSAESSVESESKPEREMVEVEGGFMVPKIELANKTLRFFAINQPQMEDSEEGIVRRFFEEFYGGELIYEQNSAADLYTTLGALVLSGDSPDVVTAHMGFPALVVQEVIQPVDGLLDFDLDIMKSRVSMYDQYEISGKHYWLPWVAPIMQHIYFNKSMLEAKNLELPDSLFLKGEWDWNVFLDYAEQLTVDDDGDGNPEIWGASMCVWHDARFVTTTGEMLVKFDGDNLVSNLSSPNLQRAYNFLADMTLRHKVADPNRDPNNILDVFNSGKSAMLVAPFFWGGTDNAFPDIKKAKNYGWVPFPKDPQADAHYVEAQGIGFYVPVGSKNLPGVEAFLYSAVVAMEQLDVPGSQNAEEAKQRFLDTWGEFGYTEEDVEKNGEFTRQVSTNVKFITNPFADLIETSLIHEDLIGVAGATPKSYEQSVSEREPGMLELIDSIFNVE